MAGEEFVVPGAGAGDGGTAVADPPAAEAEVVETPVETPEVETPETPETPTPEGQEPPAEPDLSDIETDGRKIDAKIRAEIAELKKTNPAAAKKWAESYFRNQAVMKEFPEAKTPGEAISQIRTMKATIDSLGGEQGIADLQTEVSDYRNEIDQFAKGDPALIKTLGEANPEGLAKSGTQTLDWLKANKPELYESTIRPAFLEHAAKVGVNNLITNLLGLVKEGKGQECWNLLTQADKWFKDEAEKVGAAKSAAQAKNPEAEKLANDRKEFEDQKAKDFQTRVETDVNRWNNPELDKHIGPLQKELGLQKEGMNHFRNGLISRVWQVLANDKAYIANVRSVRAKGDSVKTAEYIHKAFLERLPEQFRLHRNEIYPNIGKQKPSVPPAKGKDGKPPVTPITIAAGARPKADQVDWKKTTDAMWATGRAYLLDGSFKQGFKDAPPNKY